MPQISFFLGIKVYMYTLDHPLPHVHVQYGEFNATVEIVALKWTGKFPSQQKKMVEKWIHQNRPEILINWHKAESGNMPTKIKPLKGK